MLQIRECKEADFEQVLSLLKQLCPGQRRSREELSQLFLRGLSSDFETYICATIGTTLVGFCSLIIKNYLWAQGYVGNINELVVDEEYRGQGIGTQLLQHIVKVAREKDCRRVELDSGFHRKKAHKFYEQNGFERRAFLFSRKL